MSENGEGMREKMERANSRLADLLKKARQALRGEAEFNAEDVRRFREPVEEMEPVVARSRELRRTEPEAAEELDRYKANLNELQTTLQQVRMMLVARQASLLAGRAQLDAMAQWAAAYRRTR